MIRRLSIAVIVFAALASPARALPPLAERLPAETLVYVGWAGRNLAFDGSLAGQMLRDPAIGESIAAARAALIEAAGSEDPAGAVVGEGFADLLAILWSHPMAAALIAAPDQPQPALVLLAELGQDRPAFENRLEQMLAQLGAGEPSQTTDEQGVQWRHLPGTPVRFRFDESTLVLVVGQGVNLAGQDRLISSSRFLESYQQLNGANEQIVIWFDMVALHEAFGAEALGSGQVSLSLWDSYMSVSRIVDRGFYTLGRIRRAHPLEAAPIVSGVESPAEQLGALPADTLCGAVNAFDGRELLFELRRTLIEPAGLGEAYDRFLADWESRLGLSIQRDLLDHIGPHVRTVSAPSLGGLITGTAMIIDLRDPERFVASLQRMEQAMEAGSDPDAPGLMRSAGAELDVYWLDLPGQTPLAPAWAVHEGRLIVAAWPQVVRAASALDGEEATLADHPHFAETLGRLHIQPTAVEWIDAEALAEQVYAVLLPLWTIGANAFGDSTASAAPIDALPSLATLQSYLRPSVSAMSVDAEGVTLESYGSLPTPPMVGQIGAGAGVLTSLLLPAVANARTLAKLAISEANLQGVANALVMYQAENQTLPKSLDQLVELELLGRNQLHSPLNRLDDAPSYIYLRPREPLEQIAQPSRRILVYEDPAMHGRDETTVLYADLHVETVAVDEAFWRQVRQAGGR